MQMTNIARDVFEDFKMGRIYLPHTWLAEEGIDPSRLTSTQQRNALVRVVRRLLELAELHYRSDDAGLRYLPLRSALAVAAARHIYAEIGCQIQEKGLDAWEQRCWVRLPRKLFLVMRAMIQVARLVPERIVRPFRPVSIQHIWRFQWPTPRH
jgi:phytoene synthase